MDAAKKFVLDAQGQQELLREAQRNARDQAFRMKRAMDANEPNGVLKHAAELLRELRTSLLSPKHYYELYMQVLDELRHLESYVEDLRKSGTSIRALYERVQSSGNVLPRLYLLVTVGAVYIKSKEAPAREVLTDLVEMTKGVQHPLRGLFLRHYLSLCVKDALPDAGSAFEGDGGSVDDAIAFLLQNLSEANRLWIRMQSQKAAGAPKDRAARETERQDLRLLVGSSLVRLSQLDGVTLPVYAAQVLPQVLAAVVACKDRIAQQYLMDCVIQVFPDDFHLHSLEPMLAAMGQLADGVDVAAVLLALLERLAKYHDALGDAGQRLLYGADADGAAAKQQQLFELLVHRVDRVAASASAATVVSTMTLFRGFAGFTLACFNDSTRVACLQRVLDCCLSFVSDARWSSSTTTTITNSTTDPTVVHSYLSELLMHAVGALQLPELMRVAALRELLPFLPWTRERKAVALAVARALLARHEPIAAVAQMEFVVDVLAPLVRDDPDAPLLCVEPAPGPERDAVEAEQAQLAKVLHLVRCADLDAQFGAFAVARRAFGQGGVFRIRFTLLPLIFRSLELARALETTATAQTRPREVLQFVHEMVTALASKLEQMSVACVNLFLQCALAADRCAFEAVAYEFLTQAFIVYEDQISRSREQWKALELMVAALRATRGLSSANYEVVATKTTQHAAKLLKKHEQAAMVLNCAHLFWHPNLQDGKRVLECLQRSLRIADACTGSSASQVPLFLEILEAYLYFFEAKTPEVMQHYLNGLLALVKDHLENMEHGQTRSECEVRYRDILRYMDSRALASASGTGPALAFVASS
ncbi:hypothetical protein PybrP1_011119 [[Pythium] brassicae (nom. inval.)]|nr:hypothetical protein PybrP1_011119 [[Pythium] brassicae (nom. inval.)]